MKNADTFDNLLPKCYPLDVTSQKKRVEQRLFFSDKLVLRACRKVNNNNWKNIKWHENPDDFGSKQLLNGSESGAATCRAESGRFCSKKSYPRGPGATWASTEPNSDNLFNRILMVLVPKVFRGVRERSGRLQSRICMILAPYRALTGPVATRTSTVPNPDGFGPK